MKSPFQIHVAKENLKFSAAHFIAYPGFREPLHGHNYQVGVSVGGRLGTSGYVLDFGLIKRLTREIAGRIDGRTIVPVNSDCLQIERRGGQIHLKYEADEFVLPLSDVCLLPIVHSSAEELARYIWNELKEALGAHDALGGIVWVEVTVAESPGQTAAYREQLADK